jgi:hypothetical protein
MFTYLVALESGHFKTYSTPEDSFWCCVGTGMENHAKYGDAIYAHDDDALFVNLYIPSTLRWKTKNVSLCQATDYPRSGTVTFTLGCATPVEFSLKLRHPGWAAGPLGVSINGAAPAALDSSPGSYAIIARTWQPGDQLTLSLPLALRTEPLPGTDDQCAILFGPLVLAAALGSEDMPVPFAGFQLAQARFPRPAVSVLVTDRSDWLGGVEKISDEPLLFRTRDLARPHDVILAPFHTLHHERTAVYLSVLSPVEWENRQKAIADIEARLASARERAVDRVVIGDTTSEAAHAYAGKGTVSGVLNGRTWRQAQQSGLFTYTLATQGHGSLTLRCVVGAHDRHRPFAITIGETTVETPVFTDDAPGLVRTFDLPVPADVVREQSHVTVRFQSRGPWDSATANLFECLLLPTAGQTGHDPDR